MKSVRLLITVPVSLKAKLDALRAQGTTASGYIRCLREFKQSTKGVNEWGFHDINPEAELTKEQRDHASVSRPLLAASEITVPPSCL